MNNIYIAGAHSRAITMGYYLQYLDQNINILAYLYDNDEENPEFIGNIPVYHIDENSQLNSEATVYLGTRGANHPRLTETLTKCGIKKIIPVDVKLDLDIRNRFLKKYCSAIGRKYIKLEDLNRLSECSNKKYDNTTCVYVASSAFDKPLEKNAYNLKSYEKVIQVGTELADFHIDATYFDNEGDNISDMNPQFCELTGLYWIWKHAQQDYVGLVHYRRHFLVPVDWLERLIDNNVDVVLPLPLYVGPNIEDNYCTRHIKSNWCNMLNYLKNRDSADYEEASMFFKNTALYSPCNMFIMKREILNDLCQWMFPVLFDVANKGGQMDEKYQNRYPGFISERLITYFFEKNRNKYNVVYADKNFLT